MKQIKLSNRLNAIARFIGECVHVVDVGTDHGYLAVWLALQEQVRRITATDIRMNPLDHARATAEEYGVADRLEFLLTDGLDGLDGAGLDTVVIAGMGGETIIRILERAPSTREARVRLILQPQTKQDELVAWLAQNGFHISDASLAEDERRVYLVFTAGAEQGRVFREPLEILLDKRDPLLPVYLAGLIRKIRRALDGLEKSGGRLLETIAQVRGALHRLEKMKEETDKWQK